MIIEPAIDQQLLVNTLNNAYGIQATRLRFVPKGFVTISYMVECPGQTPERYFLKVWNNSRWGTISAGRLDTYLPLTEQLGELGLNVPRCMRAKSGTRKTRASDLTLVLYEYLEGKTLDEIHPLPPDLDEQLGRLTAQIHWATPAIDREGLVSEHFEVPFAKPLLSCLEELEAVSSRNRAGQQAMRRLLLPHKGRILALYDRLLQLGQQANVRNPALVLVHTDLNDSNLLLSASGELVVLDWEGVMLAPAEHDLFIFSGEHFLPILRAYRQASGPVTLHAETFGFYFYRRNLEDLTDWLVTILHENTSDEQDQIDLSGIQHDCIDGWPYLEEGINRVENQLRTVERNHNGSLRNPGG